jgi:hypothetical protein
LPLDDRAASPIRPSTKPRSDARAAAFLPDDQPRKLDGDDFSAVPTARLTEGATEFANALRAAGPTAQFDYDTTKNLRSRPAA